MKFGTRTDIEAPQGFVFANLADFAAWGTRGSAPWGGTGNGRTHAPARTGHGLEGELSFPGAPSHAGHTGRGNDRTAEPGPKRVGTSVDGRLQADLIPMGPRRTRLTVHIEVKPRTLAARLYLQTLRLGRKRLEAKFAERVTRIGLEIGEKVPSRGIGRRQSRLRSDG